MNAALDCQPGDIMECLPDEGTAERRLVVNGESTFRM
jgi:hypothetical protein